MLRCAYIDCPVKTLLMVPLSQTGLRPMLIPVQYLDKFPAFNGTKISLTDVTNSRALHSILSLNMAHSNTSYFLEMHCTWCVQVLRSPKEAFAAAMQSWRERCEKCVCLQGDYGEK